MTQPSPPVIGPDQGKVYGVVGHKYRLLVCGRDTDGRYAALEAVVPPGDGPPPHHHLNEVETFYVMEGRITMTVDGRDWPAGPGTFVVVPKGAVHTFRNPGPATARLLLMLVPAGFEEFFEAVGVPITDPDGDPPPSTVQHMQKVVELAPRFGCIIDNMPAEA